MHKFSLKRIDAPLLAVAILIVLIGLSSFYSIDPAVFRQQLIFLGISVVAYFFFLNVNWRIFAIFSKQIYIAMIISLLVLFFIGIEARGSVRWLDIFGIRIQFSEIIKPFFVIFLAQFLTKDDSRSFKKFFQAILLTLPIFFLILKQPDLGNALIYLFTTGFMLFAYGFPITYFLGVLIPVLLPLPILYNFLHDYQKERILTFLDPTRDPFGSSYNVVQSLISIGSGGVAGKGFGQATQSILKFLPERHTDFIFATISENLGFVGAFSLLCMYAFMLYRIVRISLNVPEDLPHMALMGFYFVLLIHIFLNIGMNIGIVPIVGITLPFASYGGSALLTDFIILGIISSIESDHKNRRTLEIM